MLTLSNTLLKDHLARGHTGPDFSNIHIVINNSLLKRPLQKTLLNNLSKQDTVQGFLGLQINTLKNLASEQSIELADKTIIKDCERVFLLSNIVKNYPKLLRSASPWQLAQDLLQLFDSLFFQSVSLPSNTEDMQALLSKAYQVDKQQFSALDFEANIIITLWQAWQEELYERKLIDEKKLFASQLAQHLNSTNKKQHWYILFLSDALNTVELEWLTKLAHSSNVHLISPITNKVNANKGYFLNQALYPDEHPDNNAISALNNNEIALLPCNSFENEAQQVLLQLRYFHSIKQNNERITLLCEDRSLVRRLRALLEQYNISLIDPFGWSLITTKAATFINAIIECAEQNYPHSALLELIKSPFAANIIDLHSAYRFEHDIVRSENIHTDIKNYKRALNKRSQRLGLWTQEERNKLASSLDTIQQACSILQLNIKKNNNAVTFTESLFKSLQALQAEQTLENDAAGKTLLETLKNMHETASNYPSELSFADYKTWLLRELSDSYLVSQEKSEDISLVNLKQSQGFSPDYLVIANATQSKLPNANNNLQFFNQRVCHELGLQTYKDNLRSHKDWFFELLIRSKQCVISWQAEKDGESQLVSSWVSSINNLHKKQFKKALINVNNSIQAPKQNNNFTAKLLKSSVTNYTALLPKDISVSAHQTLIDCPYEFFISRLLNLKSTDEIKDKLQKNDYGSLVHQAIQAFHTDVKFLPGPFELTLDASNRDAAINLLNDISKKLFTSHIIDNYQDNSWLKNWLAFVPTFIDWEIAEYTQWRHKDSEVPLSRQITSDMSLSGKIDRIDSNTNNTSNNRLLDYKTGILPTDKSIHNGENVQLTSYSLFLEHVNEVRYIGINDQGKINDRRHLKDEELETLREKTVDRLETMLNSLHDSQAIPLWVDSEKCKTCQVSSICRAKVWRSDKEHQT